MYICSLWYRHPLQVTCHLQRVTIPEAAYIQLRRRPPEDEQGNARNMYRILINVLYVNKQEFCTSSWRSTKVKMCFKLRNGFYILFGRRLGFKQVTCIVGDGGNLNTVYQLQMLVRIRWSIQGHNSYRRRMKRPV